MTTNWADHSRGAKIYNFSTQIDGCNVQNVLNPTLSELWLTEEGIPQWLCISLADLETNVCIKTIGWYCWHPYTTNPCSVTLHISSDGNRFKIWDTFTASLSRGPQLFVCAPIQTSIYPYIAFEIVKTFGSNQTYMNRIYLLSDEISPPTPFKDSTHIANETDRKSIQSSTGYSSSNVADSISSNDNSVNYSVKKNIPKLQADSVNSFREVHDHILLNSNPMDEMKNSAVYESKQHRINSSDLSTNDQTKPHYSISNEDQKNNHNNLRSNNDRYFQLSDHSFGYDTLTDMTRDFIGLNDSTDSLTPHHLSSSSLRSSQTNIESNAIYSPTKTSSIIPQQVFSRQHDDEATPPYDILNSTAKKKVLKSFPATPSQSLLEHLVSDQQYDNPKENHRECETDTSHALPSNQNHNIPVLSERIEELESQISKLNHTLASICTHGTSIRSAPKLHSTDLNNVSDNKMNHRPVSKGMKILSYAGQTHDKNQFIKSKLYNRKMLKRSFKKPLLNLNTSSRQEETVVNDLNDSKDHKSLAVTNDSKSYHNLSNMQSFNWSKFNPDLLRHSIQYRSVKRAAKSDDPHHHDSESTVSHYDELLHRIMKSDASDDDFAVAAHNRTNEPDYNNERLQSVQKFVDAVTAVDCPRDDGPLMSCAELYSQSMNSTITCASHGHLYDSVRARNINTLKRASLYSKQVFKREDDTFMLEELDVDASHVASRERGSINSHRNSPDSVVDTDSNNMISVRDLNIDKSSAVESDCVEHSLHHDGLSSEKRNVASQAAAVTHGIITNKGMDQKNNLGSSHAMAMSYDDMIAILQKKLNLLKQSNAESAKGAQSESIENQRLSALKGLIASIDGVDNLNSFHHVLNSMQRIFDCNTIDDKRVRDDQHHQTDPLLLYERVDDCDEENVAKHDLYDNNNINNDDIGDDRVLVSRKEFHLSSELDCSPNDDCNMIMLKNSSNRQSIITSDAMTFDKTVEHINIQQMMPPPSSIGSDENGLEEVIRNAEIQTLTMETPSWGTNNHLIMNADPYISEVNTNDSFKIKNNSTEVMTCTQDKVGNETKKIAIAVETNAGQTMPKGVPSNIMSAKDNNNDSKVLNEVSGALKRRVDSFNLGGVYVSRAQHENLRRHHTDFITAPSEKIMNRSKSDIHTIKRNDNDCDERRYEGNRHRIKSKVPLNTTEEDGSGKRQSQIEVMPLQVLRQEDDSATDISHKSCSENRMNISSIANVMASNDVGHYHSTNSIYCEDHSVTRVEVQEFSDEKKVKDPDLRKESAHYNLNSSISTAHIGMKSLDRLDSNISELLKFTGEGIVSVTDELLKRPEDDAFNLRIDGDRDEVMHRTSKNEMSDAIETHSLLCTTDCVDDQLRLITSQLYRKLMQRTIRQVQLSIVKRSLQKK